MHSFYWFYHFCNLYIFCSPISTAAPCWNIFFLHISSFQAQKRAVGFLDNNQCNKDEHPSFMLPPLVTVGVDGISKSSQRPQKHVVGSVKYVRSRMRQCHISKERCLGPKQEHNRLYNTTEHLLFSICELRSVEKEKSIYV